MAPLGPQQSALAFLARRRPGPSSGPPGSVLFLVDRSRSVGLPGLSAERDLVRALIEALPPSTRFDALFFDRGTKRLFPMSRPATREAIERFEAEMVPDRMQNGTDLPGALREAGALLRREATTFGPRALLVLVTDGALGDEDGAALDRALGEAALVAKRLAARPARRRASTSRSPRSPSAPSTTNRPARGPGTPCGCWRRPAAAWPASCARTRSATGFRPRWPICNTAAIWARSAWSPTASSDGSRRA